MIGTRSATRPAADGMKKARLAETQKIP